MGRLLSTIKALDNALDMSTAARKARTESGGFGEVFDPAKKDSANLLAGGAAAAVGLGAATQSDDSEAGPLMAGAKRALDPRFLNGLGGSNPRVGLKSTVEGMETGVRPREMDKGGEFSLYDFEGSPYILTQSDRAAAGGDVTSVHGAQIDPVSLRGGRDFMFDTPSEGQVWASDPNVVKSLLTRAKKLEKEHGGETLLLPYSMAPTGIDFATMPLDVMIGFAREKMSKANTKNLDSAIKKLIPTWGGVKNPDSVKAFRDVKGPIRKKIADLMDKNFRDVRGGMSISEARAATTDVEQYLSPEGQITNIGRVDTTRSALSDSGHPTYHGGLPGEGVGTFKNPLDVRPFMAQNGRQLTGDAADIRSLSMNHGLSQGIITKELLKSIYGGAAGAAIIGGALSSEEAEANTAMVNAADQFSVLRKEKQGLWQNYRQDIMGAIQSAEAGLQPLMPSINGALEAIDMPMRGIHGLTAVAGSLAAGGSFDQAMNRGAQVSQQPIGQTADQLGGAVVDATGSPMLGTAVNTAVNFADINPI